MYDINIIAQGYNEMSIINSISTLLMMRDKLIEAEPSLSELPPLTYG